MHCGSPGGSIGVKESEEAESRSGEAHSFGPRLEVSTSASRLDDRLLDHRPVVHHELVVEPERLEAVSGRDGIAQSITVSAIGAVMTHPTIDLEDESISEHEVDPPDTGDLDLG